MSETHKPFHVRVTRIHATGAATSRDVDIRDREQWKRLVRGAKETLEQGGEHHLRPLYPEDAPAVSVPAPLKLRVEALEAGIQDVLKCLYDDERQRFGITRSVKILESLLIRKPETKETGN